MSRPAIIKKFNLAGIAEGWTDEHFINYRPFNYSDIEALEGIDKDSKDGVKQLTAILADKFVSGSWYVSDDNGENLRTEAMTAGDIRYLPVDATNTWLKEAMGKLDPKAAAN